MQTEATLLANISPNIVECLHVVSICTPCCMLLGVVVQNKQVRRLSQQLPTFLLLRDRQILAQQCWIRLHSSSNSVGATHMHHHTWSPKSYGLCPSHDTLLVPTLLGVVASACKQLPTRMQQLPTLLAQQCLDLLHLSACSFRHSYLQYGIYLFLHMWFSENIICAFWEKNRLAQKFFC